MARPARLRQGEGRRHHGRYSIYVAADSAAADQYSADSYSADQYSADSYAASAAQQQPAQDQYTAAQYAAQQEPQATNPYGYTAQMALETTDQELIAKIAQYAPELRPCIARNPSTYPALVTGSPS